MTVDTADNICTGIPDLSHIHIAGGGEPFLHPYIDDILNVFTKHNIYMSIVTNGSIPYSKRWDMFSEIIMSVHDTDPIRYRQITGGDVREVLPNIPYASLIYNVITCINGPYIEDIEQSERNYGASHVFSVPVKDWFITGSIVDNTRYVYPVYRQLPFTFNDPPEARRIFISASGGVVPWCSKLDPNRYVCGNINTDSTHVIMKNIHDCSFRRQYYDNT